MATASGGPSVLVKILGDLTGFSKSVGDAGNKAASTAGQAKAAWGSFLTGLNQTGALGPLSGMLDNLSQGIDALAGHARGVGPAMAAAGAAVTGLGVTLSAFGSKEQAAQQQLRQAIENTGQSYDDYGGAIERAIKHQEDYGHTADETENALQALTQATHDPQKALDLLGEASDLAAAKHMDLSDAATQLGRVYNGNTRLLKQFGIEIDSTTGRTKDGKTATEALAGVLAGQASAATDTFGGHLDALKAKIEDQIALFGQKWGPAIQTAGVAMMTFGSLMSTMPAIIALVTNPFVLLAIAIIIVTVAVIVLYAKWDEVWKKINSWPWWAKVLFVLALIVTGIGEMIVVIAFFAVYWTTIWGVISTVASWVWDHVLHPVFSAIATAWGDVAAVFLWVWDHVLHPVFTFVATAAVLMAEVIGTTFGAVKKFVEDYLVAPFSWAWDEIRKFIGWIMDKVDAVTGAIGKVPGLSTFLQAAGAAAGAPNAVLNALGLQHGGIVTTPTLALLGEAGPEAVIPLDHVAAAAPQRAGPAVVIENAHFAKEIDVELFMKRVAWHAQTGAV